MTAHLFSESLTNVRGRWPGTAYKPSIIFISCHNATQGTLTHFTHITGLADSSMGAADDRLPAETHRSCAALPTVSCYQTTACQWKGALSETLSICVTERDSEGNLSGQHCADLCVFMLRHSECIWPVAALNIWSRYEISVRFSCCGSSWVRVSAIVSSESSCRNEKNSAAW